MAALREKFQSKQAAAVTQAIAGKGGIRKTTLVEDMARPAVELKVAAADERGLLARRITDALERNEAIAAAVELMRAAFPFDLDEVGIWARSGQLVSHAPSAAGHAEREKAGLRAAACVLNEVSLYLKNRGQFIDALGVARRA